jgi:late competence protein required for DNA uptake (superfamily II DNA/RNA helicase)
VHDQIRKQQEHEYVELKDTDEDDDEEAECESCCDSSSKVTHSCQTCSVFLCRSCLEDHNPPEDEHISAEIIEDIVVISFSLY